MKRKTVNIDEAKCDGCGLCVTACHEGALALVDGKARLIAESYCDGLGDCLPKCPTGAITIEEIETPLSQWPCQIKLVPVDALYLADSHLLVAADCTAYAYANIHQDFMDGRVTLIGCPKLDQTNYAEKLGQIIKINDIKSITVLRMEVNCCGGLTRAVQNALLNAGKQVPGAIFTIGIDGVIKQKQNY